MHSRPSVASLTVMEIMNNPDEDIAWEPARDTNKQNWEERVAIHVASGYDLASFRGDPEHLSQVVKDDYSVLRAHLPNSSVAGLRLCHLQCHIGTDTLSFARLGARVTGVDFSPAALKFAAGFARELGLAARWVETDVLDAAAAVGDTFDVVYTSIGTITWLNDLDRWAKQIAQLLVAGGTFYFRDGHPMLYAFDETTYPPVARYGYFPTGLAQSWDDPNSYAGEGTIASTRTYEWPHSIAEILTALLGAGLQIIAVDEGKTLPWEFSTHMIKRADGDYEWPDDLCNVIPCTLTIVARKP